MPLPTISGATPSQRLFSIATGIDSRSLSFSGQDKKEFFLFMDLRERFKWVSFKLSLFDWVGVASIYNTELQALKAREGRAFVNKTPRALMEFLTKMETTILSRIARGDFKSTYSLHFLAAATADILALDKDGSTTFWTRHCHAVPLTAKSQSCGEVDTKKKLVRSPMLASRYTFTDRS